MPNIVRVAGVNASLSMKARSRHWEFTSARLEDITPTIWDPFALVDDAALPGTAVQLTGTILIVNADEAWILGDVTPGSVYQHNVRNVLTYTTGSEATWGNFYEGSLVYYDRSSTMPAGAFLSLANQDSGTLASPRFGVVVRGAGEPASDFPKGQTTAGVTHGAAVMQFGVLSSLS